MKLMKKFLALILAMLTLCACAAAEGVMTHEEYVAAELDTEVVLTALHKAVHVVTLGS